MLKKMKKGFTLIELLVVIAIIAILATVVIINVTAARAKSADAKVLADMSTASKTAAACLAEDSVLITGASATTVVLDGTARTPTVGGPVCNPSANTTLGNWPKVASKGLGGTWAWKTTMTFSSSALVFEVATGTAATDFRVKCTTTGCTKYMGDADTTTVTW